MRERYKSPLISDTSYLINTIGYIWLNFYRATGHKPQDYRYCSLFYRFRGLKSKLLDDYASLPVELGLKTMRAVASLLDSFLAKAKEFVSTIYEHTHTIGSMSEVKMRDEYFRFLCKRE